MKEITEIFLYFFLYFYKNNIKIFIKKKNVPKQLTLFGLNWDI